MRRQFILKNISVLFIAGVLLFGCAGNSANTKATNPEGFGLPAPPKPDVSFEAMQEMEKQGVGSYQLGPGDRITINVYGEESLTRTVTISLSGTFTFPLIGEVKAIDIPVAQVIKEMDLRLEHYLKGARSDIVINEFSNNRFVILGSGFTAPGIYSIVGEVRLLDAVAMAGGLRAIDMNDMEVLGADLKRGYLSRGGKILPVNFQALILSGDSRYNIRIWPKDVVYIPLATSSEILILGEVNSSAAIPMVGNMTLTKAVVLAGDFTDLAKISKVRVIRNSAFEPKVFVINVELILKGKTPDFILEANDIVFVPQGFF